MFAVCGELRAANFNINFHFIECIELHLNITPFEGYPQGTDQGQGGPNNPNSGKSKKLKATICHSDRFVF